VRRAPLAAALGIVGAFVGGLASGQVAVPTRVAPDWGAPATMPGTTTAARPSPPVSLPPVPSRRPPQPIAAPGAAPAPAVSAAPTAAAGGAAAEIYGPPTTREALARLPDDAVIAFGDGSVRLTAAELRRAAPAIEQQARASLQPAPAPPNAPELRMGAGPSRAGAAASARAPTAYQPPRVGTYAPLGCGAQRALGAESRIAAVDGVARGAVLTPRDAPVVITGCGFGSNTGQAGVYLVAAQHGFLQRLQVWSWSDTQIRAMWETAPSGFQDFDGLAVRIELADGRRLEQDGHRFVAAREKRALGAWPRELLLSAGTRPMPELAPGDGATTTAVVQNVYSPDAQFCDAKLTRIDRLRVGALRLPAGWVVEDVVVRNLTSQELADTGESFWPPAYVILGRDARVQNAFDAHWEGDELVVTPQWHSLYVKKFLWLGGYSSCSSKYAFAVVVSGPKGTWP
jgi:hypothetical protein